MEKIHHAAALVHILPRGQDAQLAFVPTLSRGEPSVEVRLCRRSPSSRDPADFAPTPAGFLVAVAEVPQFIALLQHAAREVQP